MDYFEEVLQKERVKAIRTEIQKQLCDKLEKERIPAFIKENEVIVELSESNMTIVFHKAPSGWTLHLLTRLGGRGFRTLDEVSCVADGDVERVVEVVKASLQRLAKEIAEAETS